MTNTPESIAQSWLRYVHSWLNYWDNSSLSSPAELLLARLEERRKKNESKLAWDTMNDLRRLSDKSEEKECAEILLCCGLVAAEMDNFRDALKLFQGASSKYTTSQHHRAVAFWMAGCVQWLLPNKEVDAINSWRTSMKAFEALRDYNKSKGPRYDWYEKRCQDMAFALDSATKQYMIPALPEDSGEGAQNQNTDGEHSQTLSTEDSTHVSPIHHTVDSSKARMNITVDRLSVFSVYDHIAAGDFSPSGILLEPISNMEIDRVLIDDCQYGIFSLSRDQRILNLAGEHGFYLLRVHGTSMNKAKPISIENGDYVLMRAQRTADNGDIVAAEISSIDNQDNQATLKRFVKSNGKIYLLPESDNPKYIDKMDANDYYTKLDHGFHICGKALAVFKPMSD